jgi:hypothetical protein
MKRKLLVLGLLVFIVAIMIVGCKNEAATTVSESSGLSSATRLALGTIMLEDTDQAVIASQASDLVTLWQAYQSLSNSDTTSQVELDALVQQIQGVMTGEQIKSIEALNLTGQTVDDVMQSLGGSTGDNAPGNTPDASAQDQAAPMGGPGGMPGGGDSVMSEIGNAMVTQSTPAASQPAADTQTDQVNVMLLNALIQLLVTRSQTTG